MKKAQASYKLYANQHRSPAPNFQIGDLVWLSRKNISSIHPINKLDHRQLGPFKISGIVGKSSFRLELPATMHAHNAFHVSLLSPYVENPFEGRNPTPPPPVIVDEEEELEVKTILDSRIRYGRLQHLVHWKGQSINERTWEPSEYLKNAPDLVEAYHTSYPTRSTPADIKKKQDCWKALTLLELRAECKARNLLVRGSKPQLLKRLSSFKFFREG